MQLRRVLLLFALVLGLSALVASIAPPREDESPESPATVAEPPRASAPEPIAPPLKLKAGEAHTPDHVRRVSVGAGFTLQVSVPAPGDVVLEGLGLRQSADGLTPARFDSVADRDGRHRVLFHPVEGGQRVVGTLVFKPRQRDR